MAVIKALATRAVQIDREVAAQDALEKLRENASSGDDSDRKKNDNARKRDCHDAQLPLSHSVSAWEPSSGRRVGEPTRSVG